jgi:hypothetical protein
LQKLLNINACCLILAALALALALATTNAAALALALALLAGRALTTSSKTRRSGAMLDTVDIARGHILWRHTCYQSSLGTLLEIEVALRCHVFILYIAIFTW